MSIRFLHVEKKPQRRFAGHCITTSLVKRETPTLWKSFRKELSGLDVSAGRIGQEFYSISIYPGKISEFNPSTEFDKWAAFEVQSEYDLPGAMKPLTMPDGMFAIFEYQGTPATFFQATNYIFNEWIPHSIYEVEARPHFEVLDERYIGPQNPDSVEDIWIPIKQVD